MQGFFTKEQVEVRDLSRSRCFSCGKDAKCSSPKLEPTGEFAKKILILNDRITENCDNKGTHLSRSSTRFLTKLLKRYGIDLKKDCMEASAICCKAGSDSNIEDVRRCQNRILSLVKEHQPKVIIALGVRSVQSLFDGRFSMGGGIEKWEGWQIPDYDNGCWVCTSYHPRDIEQHKAGELVQHKVESAINKAIACKDRLLPKYSPAESRKRCKLLFSDSDVNDILDRINSEPDCIAFDYETTGLDCYADWFEIRTCSVCYKKISYAFELTEGVSEKLMQVLSNPKVLKIGANIKFESKATQKVFDCSVDGWVHDCVITAHTLDNRADITSVKFQAFVNLGVTDYSSDMNKYLKGRDKNSPNNIFKAPLKELLLYNALDSLYEYEVGMIQRREVRRGGLLAANELLLNGAETFVDVENNGFAVDEEYLHRQNVLLTKKIARVKRQLSEDPIIKKWKKKYGNKFNMDSDDQLRDILFEDMKLEPPKLTAKGKPAVDKESLQKLGLSFFDKKMQQVKFKLVQDTYLAGVFRHVQKGVVHPNYALNTATTYRSSCIDPNLQNVPVRDKETSKFIRGGFVPRPGNILCEVDYSGAEVRVSYCYNLDPVLYAYLNDPSKDMHRDVSMDCLILPQDEMTGEIRFYGKNDFTFAQFYGDYYKNCARSLWDDINRVKLTTKSGQLITEHLYDEGIKNYEKFEKHIQAVEDHFWNVRFKVYNAWKKEFYQRYLKQGFIDTLTGFRLSRIMSKNDVINYPVQGSAFHCLLWSLTQINANLKRRGCDSCVIGQIHDSILLDIVPAEKDEVLRIVKRIMTEDVREHWDWIKVPLKVECEGSTESWFKKQEFAI